MTRKQAQTIVDEVWRIKDTVISHTENDSVRAEILQPVNDLMWLTRFVLDGTSEEYEDE